MHALPALVVFFYRNLLSIPNESVSTVMTVLLNCLSDDNVEVREMASKALSGIVRVSQRQSIIPLKVKSLSSLLSVQTWLIFPTTGSLRLAGAQDEGTTATGPCVR